MEIFILMIANMFFLTLILSILLIILSRKNEDTISFKVDEDIKKIKNQIN